MAATVKTNENCIAFVYFLQSKAYHSHTDNGERLWRLLLSSQDYANSFIVLVAARYLQLRDASFAKLPIIQAVEQALSFSSLSEPANSKKAASSKVSAGAKVNLGAQTLLKGLYYSVTHLPFDTASPLIRAVYLQMTNRLQSHPSFLVNHELEARVLSRLSVPPSPAQLCRDLSAYTALHTHTNIKFDLTLNNFTSHGQRSEQLMQKLARLWPTPNTSGHDAVTPTALHTARHLLCSLPHVPASVLSQLSHWAKPLRALTGPRGRVAWALQQDIVSAARTPGEQQRTHLRTRIHVFVDRHHGKQFVSHCQEMGCTSGAPAGVTIEQLLQQADSAYRDVTVLRNVILSAFVAYFGSVILDEEFQNAVFAAPHSLLINLVARLDKLV